MNDDVHVRAAAAADASGICAIYARVVAHTPASFEVTPPDEHEITRRMASSPRLPWFVATHRQRLVGYAYATKHRERAAYRWSAECSVYVAEGHRGHGVGRSLYERLVAEMRGLNYVSLLAGITLPNEPSVALHEAVGFQPVGVFRRVGFKHGAWHDVGWWQLTVSQSPDRPEEPLAWDGANPF